MIFFPFIPPKMARACLILVLVVFLVEISEVRAICPTGVDYFYYEGTCFKVFDKKMNLSKAEGECTDLEGNWRLPTGDELHGTKLNFFWVLGPDSQKCYGTANAKETKVIEIDCNAKAGTACILVEDGVPSKEEAQLSLSLSTDKILRTEHSNIPKLGDEITMNMQEFQESLLASTTSRRKKRQAVNPGVRGRVLSKLQGGGRRTIAGGRTITNRLSSSNRRFSSIGLQVNPGNKETPRKPSNQETSIPSRFAAGPPDAASPSERREMCMGEWKRIGRSCVKLFNEPLSWNEAQAACETFIYKQSKASLINLGNKEMINRLIKWLSEEGEDGVSFWTSGNDIADEEAPLWTDTDAITESDDVIGDSDEKDCVVNTNNHLQFDSCVQTYSYVCEMREPNITEEDLIR